MTVKKSHTTKTPLTRILLILLGGLIGLVAGKWAGSAIKELPSFIIIINFILFVPAFFLTIAVHEVGHAIAGALVNFDFKMYVVGPFMWSKEADKWKFKWNKNLNTSGGLVISLPTSTENLANRFATYAMGGPIASLLFAGLAFSIKQLLIFINSDHVIVAIMSSSLGMMAFFSLFIFIMTSVPVYTGGFYTDGARALRFLRGGDTSRFEVLLLTILTTSSSGVRPRLLNINYIHEAQLLAEKLNAPMGIYLNYFLYQHAFDDTKFEEAEKYLHAYIAEIGILPKGLQSSVFLEAAYFYAFACNNLEKAEYYYAQYVPSVLTPKALVLAVEAGINLLKGNTELAFQKRDSALKEIPNMIDQGVGVSLKEMLLKMQAHV